MRRADPVRGRCGTALIGLIALVGAVALLLLMGARSEAATMPATAESGSRNADALIPALRACSTNAACSPVLARLLTACLDDSSCKQAAAQFFTAHPDVLAAVDTAFPALNVKIRITDVIVTS